MRDNKNSELFTTRRNPAWRHTRDNIQLLRILTGSIAMQCNACSVVGTVRTVDVSWAQTPSRYSFAKDSLCDSKSFSFSVETDLGFVGVAFEVKALVVVVVVGGGTLDDDDNASPSSFPDAEEEEGVEVS